MGEQMKIKKLFYIFSILFVSVCLAVSGCSKSGTNVESPPEVPGIPTGISASDGTFGNQVQLDWTASERAESYRVYKSLDSADSEYRLVKSDVMDITFNDETVSVGRKYYYRIVAVNSGGMSEMSDVDFGFAGAEAPEPPASPKNLNATNDKLHHVYLNWNPVAGAEKYHVYKAEFPDVEFIKISPEEGITDLNLIDIDSTLYSYDDNGTAESVEGKAFYYRIKAENADGLSGFSDVVGGWFPYDVPGNPPANVSATDGDFANKVVISWDSVEEASSYVIYKKEDTGGGCTNPSDGSYSPLNGGITATSYDDTAVTDQTVYCYSLRSKNSLGECLSYSNRDSGFASTTSGVNSPSAPELTGASSSEENQITVYWTRADTFAIEYEIYRSDSADGDYGIDPVGIVADSGVDNYTYTDATVAYDTDYFYKVKAVNTEAESSMSNYLTGMALPTVPPAPADVSASDGSFWNQIEISWSETARAETYKVFRSTSEEGTYDEIVSGLDVTSFVDDTITFAFGTTYFYKVLGINTGGDGDLSVANGGYVELAAPGKPAVADGGPSAVDVSWNAVDGAQAYKIYYIRNIGKSGIADNYVPETSYKHSSLSLWYKYKYQVSAIRDGHEGPKSPESDYETSD